MSLNSNTVSDLQFIETIPKKRDEQRTVYNYNGVDIWHDVKLPINPFKKQVEFAIIDLCLSREKYLKKYPDLDLVEVYCEETHGYPKFVGKNCLDKAQNFINEFKQT